MKICLGINDVPYANTDASGVVMTGDVALILEAKYGVMQHFYDAHKVDIASDLESAIAAQAEAIMEGAPPSPRPMFEAEAAIVGRFKTFLMTGEIETMGIPGVPTQASIKRRNGGSSTRKNVANTGPSFVDSGIYENSFRCEIK